MDGFDSVAVGVELVGVCLAAQGVDIAVAHRVEGIALVVSGAGIVGGLYLIEGIVDIGCSAAGIDLGEHVADPVSGIGGAVEQRAVGGDRLDAGELAAGIPGVLGLGAIAEDAREYPACAVVLVAGAEVGGIFHGEVVNITVQKAKSVCLLSTAFSAPVYPSLWP